MEKKKNNAVEKAEQVAEKNDSVRSKKTQKNINGVKKSKQSNKKTKSERAKKAIKLKKERALKREKLKEEKALAKEQKEKAMAQKRVELAKIKAHKKAEKEKAKATALREKNRRKAEYKKRKQELKAEKDARREALKKESKQDKRERIAKEREAKRVAKMEKRKHTEEKRRAIAQERALKREQKAKERQKNKERRKGYGGWLAAVISLGLATIVLASVLTFTFLMPTTEDNLLESTYQKNFYDTVEQIDNIDVNLSKILATKDSGAMQKYLVDTAINSELAENDLGQLPLHDESKHYTTKLINQIGDYSKHLNDKIISGQGLEDKDYQTLQVLYKANRALKDALQQMISKMGEDFSFSSMLEDGSKNLVIEGFEQLENLSVGYPQLIYDGPFSDGLREREIKALKGAEIDESMAREKFNKIFQNYELKSVESMGAVSGEIECFNVQAQVNDDILFAQISKKGGELVMFSYAGSCNAVHCDSDDATEVAGEFLTSLGIKNMKPVWINLANNVYTINFAYEQDGVIVYSDLVKVRVCAETRKVIGLEARSYYTNHTDRVIGKATLSCAQAKKNLSSSIDVATCRLALVPVGTASEKLCYEFSGEYDGSTYYVYIDAVSGRQVEMFKVIESTEGTLLI